MVPNDEISTALRGEKEVNLSKDPMEKSKVTDLIRIRKYTNELNPAF